MPRKKTEVEVKKQNHLEKEWNAFLKREEKVLRRYGRKKEPFLEKKLQAVMPDSLSGKLEEAFLKAFSVILKNGTGVIEKTYAKEKLAAEYKIREYTQTVYGTRRSLTAGKRKAKAQTARNVAGAGAEGAVLGLLGIGLPDIPLFLGVILRSLYMLALNYGIDYEDAAEQELLLDLLALSLCREGNFQEQNAAMNRRLFEMAEADRRRTAGGSQENEKSCRKSCSPEAVRRAAKALSGELLYMKFLQGVPVVGAVGGIYDGIYLKKITDFAAVKLERRYLLSKSCLK